MDTQIHKAIYTKPYLKNMTIDHISPQNTVKLKKKKYGKINKLLLFVFQIHTRLYFLLLQSIKLEKLKSQQNKFVIIFVLYNFL